MADLDHNRHGRAATNRRQARLCDAARLEIDVSGGKELSAEEVIATLSAALVERYGEDALAVALRQADLAEGLPLESWEAIVARLREMGRAPGSGGPSSDG